MSEGQEPKTFSEDYVKTLRDENAAWRNKVRDLEVNVAKATIGAELAKRGIKAEAHWVNIKEGQSAEHAVEEFAQAYPHLAGQVEPTDQGPSDEPTDLVDTVHRKIRVDGPKPQAPKPKETPTVDSLTQSRKLSEIRKDPQARAQLAKSYRAMLAKQSHQSAPIE